MNANAQKTKFELNSTLYSLTDSTSQGYRSDFIAPAVLSEAEVFEQMGRCGMVVVSSQLVEHTVNSVMRSEASSLHTVQAYWHNLPPDTYLKDGGRYRARRHSCFVVEEGRVDMVAHRAHFQPLEYNALHGGMYRRFEPIEEALTQSKLWHSLMKSMAAWCSQAQPAHSGQQDTWFIEAHQFRIDTTDGIGRPTPEGAHRDGVDFVMVFLLDRVGIKGGETRVFEAHGPNGQRFTLTEPWSVLWMDDARVVHESTPIQPVDEFGYRDTLVLTFRRGGFLGGDE